MHNSLYRKENWTTINERQRLFLKGSTESVHFVWIRTAVYLQEIILLRIEKLKLKGSRGVKPIYWNLLTLNLILNTVYAGDFSYPHKLHGGKTIAQHLTASDSEQHFLQRMLQWLKKNISSWKVLHMILKGLERKCGGLQHENTNLKLDWGS